MEHKNNKIQSSNGRKRLNCIGYLNLTTMDVHHKIYDKEAINAKTFIALSIIQLHYLPADSPNLKMHQYFSNNKVYKDFKEFKQSIMHFFNNTLSAITPLLYSRITDNFHILSENKKETKQRKS